MPSLRRNKLEKAMNETQSVTDGIGPTSVKSPAPTVNSNVAMTGDNTSNANSRRQPVRVIRPSTKNRTKGIVKAIVSIGNSARRPASERRLNASGVRGCTSFSGVHHITGGSEKKENLESRAKNAR